MATLSVTTPYKSGTLSSIGTGANGANTRLNTSGITWVAGDVGTGINITYGSISRDLGNGNGLKTYYLGVHRQTVADALNGRRWTTDSIVS